MRSTNFAGLQRFLVKTVYPDPLIKGFKDIAEHDQHGCFEVSIGRNVTKDGGCYYIISCGREIFIQNCTSMDLQSMGFGNNLAIVPLSWPTYLVPLGILPVIFDEPEIYTTGDRLCGEISGTINYSAAQSFNGKLSLMALRRVSTTNTNYEYVVDLNKTRFHEQGVIKFTLPLIPGSTHATAGFMMLCLCERSADRPHRILSTLGRRFIPFEDRK